jgi:hypothetical protein
MKALLTLALALLLAGCAAGQGSAGRSIAEETTANGTEETTVYKEETTTLTGEGGFPQPPDSTLSYGGQEVKGTLGSYVWTAGDVGSSADASWPLIPSKQKMLTVPSDSEMVFRYGGQSPPKTVGAGAYLLNKLQKTGTMRPDHSLKAQGSGVQRTISAELPPGEYVLEVSVKAPQGDAAYYFRVMVE